MSIESNKQAIIRYAEVVWNNGDLEAVADFIAADFVRHNAGEPTASPGPESIRQLVQVYRGAFPDLHFAAEVLLAEGDLVAVRWQMRGAQQGELMGIPATGRQIAIAATDIYRLADGKIAEQWVSADSLGLWEQLGVVAMPSQG